MNQDQVLGFIRQIVSMACGVLLGRGWITAEQVPMILAAVAGIVPLIWSFMAHSNKAKVASAQAVPSAQVLVSDPTLASPGVQVANVIGPDKVSVEVPKP